MHICDQQMPAMSQNRARKVGRKPGVAPNPERNILADPRSAIASFGQEYIVTALFSIADAVSMLGGQCILVMRDTVHKHVFSQRTSSSSRL